jgi:cobalt-zinc-cadmium efflux system membrane fusion protein
VKRLAAALALAAALGGWAAKCAFAAPAAKTNHAAPQLATRASGVVKVATGSQAERDIRIAPVVTRRLAEIISATALVEPDAREVAQIAPPIAARVVKLVADPGQEIKPGQPLVILSSIELGQAKAEFLKARSLSGIANQNLEREERLFKEKISSMKDVLDARAAQATTLSQYKASREALRLLIPGEDLDRLDWRTDRQQLAEFALTSPIPGTLVKRDLTVGEQLDRNQDVMTVMSLDHVWVLASVFEHDLHALALGQQVHVKVDAYPDDHFTGTVAYISDVLDRSTRTVQARIVVPNTSRKLKPGMFARVEIAGGGPGKEVVAVPPSAIYEIDGAKVVFVPAGAQSFRMEPVKIGRKGDDGVEIVSGLHEGQQVVIAGGLVLKSLFVNQGGD